jgi:hypothetical protein
MSLIIFYPFAMHLKCDYASAGYTRPTAKNSDQTVMQQWCNSDASTVMRQWYNSHAFDSSSFLCLLFGLFNVIFKLLRCHWSYFIILKWLGSVSMIIFYPFAMPWGCDKWHKTFWQKQWPNSDETVIEQWCDSDGTVIPLIWALQYHLQGFKMILMKLYPFAIPWECDYASAGDTRPFDKNSDQTVMRQWCNSDAFDFTFKLLKCDYASFGDTRPFDKHSDQTVMQQWCLLISALLYHLHGFEMLLIVLYPVAKPWGCVWKTVIKQW